MKRAILIILVMLVAAGSGLAQADKPLLLQKPTLSRTQVAFAYAGDLWIVSREGGPARRLTTGTGTEADPFFSPDGQWIAFTGEYDGNVDLYVVAASGGVPKRLTYHPGPDIGAGWTPDGKQILFRSARNSYSRFARLFTVGLDGALPAELPLPMASDGSFSPDGARIAYEPLGRAFQAWKRYRGGRTSYIAIANLADSSIEKLPRDNSNDFNPMWIDNRVYFLSDRSGAVTLFSYDPASKRV
ncbi:MAG TPA: protease, partial [Blastocatellia bacterium]